MKSEVATLLGPLIVLLGEDGADEADDCVAVRGDSHVVGATVDLPAQSLARIVRPDLPLDALQEGGEREDLYLRCLEVREASRKPVLEGFQDPVELHVNGLRADRTPCRAVSSPVATSSSASPT